MAYAAEYQDSSGIIPTFQSVKIGKGSSPVARTVTQASSITTGVTLNRASGTITTVASTLAAAAEATFTVTNSHVETTDVVVVSTTYAGAGTPIVYVQKVAAGSFDISISNLHASDALDAVLVINFIIIKAS